MRLNAEQGVEPTVAEVVARGVERVPLRTPTLPPATRTNAYIVRGESGLWVVDPGAGDAAECAVLAEAMAAAERRERVPVVGAILTHHHPDHVGGLGWWVQSVGLPVVAESRTISLVTGAAARETIGEVDGIEWLDVDGDAEVDGLQLVFTPGHAPGHLAVWTGSGSRALEPRVLIAGDLVAGIGTIVVNPPRGNMKAYLSSLESAARLGPSLLLPSHGPGTTEAVERLRGYIAHRLAREAKIVAAIGPAWTTIAELTASAYDDVPAALHGFAERSVLAHLEKLVAESRVEVQGDRVRLRAG